MATYAWPSGRIFIPQTVSWGESMGVRTTGDSPYTSNIQTQEIPYSHRWMVELTMLPTASFAERAQQEGWLSRLRGGVHRCTFYHWQHPAPYGTMRGAPVLFGTHLQGTTTINITTTTGYTLIEGDMIGVTTTAGVQLVRVVVGGTSAGNLLTVSVEPPLRTGANANAAVVWDKPTATFMLQEPQWRQTSSARNAAPIVVSFREVW